MSELGDGVSNAKTRAAQLVNAGSEITGSVAGTGLGLILGGPVGAIVGAAAAPVLIRVLTWGGAEIQQRMLGPREHVRAGAAYAFALKRVSERLNSGDEPRNDDFFAERLDDRPAAAEILEGGLLAAQREHEERKLRWLGNLIANINFERSVSRATANYFLRVASNLSYRQIKLLAFTIRSAELKVPALPENAEKVGSKVGCIPPDLAIEISELGGFGLFSGGLVYNLARFNPHFVTVSELGAQLFALMQLQNIPAHELQDIMDYYEV